MSRTSRGVFACLRGLMQRKSATFSDDIPHLMRMYRLCRLRAQVCPSQPRPWAAVADVLLNVYVLAANDVSSNHAFLACLPRLRTTNPEVGRTVCDKLKLTMPQRYRSHVLDGEGDEKGVEEDEIAMTLPTAPSTSSEVTDDSSGVPAFETRMFVLLMGCWCAIIDVWSLTRLPVCVCSLGMPPVIVKQASALARKALLSSVATCCRDAFGSNEFRLDTFAPPAMQHALLLQACSLLLVSQPDTHVSKMVLKSLCRLMVHDYNRVRV